MIDPYRDMSRPQRQPQAMPLGPLAIQMPLPAVPQQIMGPFGDPQQPQQIAPDPMPMPEPPMRSVLRPEDRIRQIKNQQPRW